MNVWYGHVQSQVFFAFCRNHLLVIIVSCLLSALGPIALVSDPGLLIGTIGTTGTIGPIGTIGTIGTIGICVRSFGLAGLAGTVRATQ